MGGGEYGRSTTLTASVAVRTVGGNDASALQQALDESASGGVVEITDSGVYAGSFAVVLEDGAAVELRAADRRRATLRLSGDLIITGGAGSELTLNGLLIDGGALVVPALDATGAPNGLRRLRLEHCTIRPGAPAVSIVIDVPELRLELDHSVTGALQIVETAEAVVDDSIIDAGDPAAVAYEATSAGPAAPLTVRDSTVIGKVLTRIMTLASNTIFLARLAPADSWIAPVRAERLQEGCVRFSFVPPGSLVPRRHRCHPQNAAAAVRVRPVFCSLQYGDPGYALLHPMTPAEIAAGADDGAEMGAFHDLYAPQRVGALNRALQEQLRFGLEAGIFYAS
jgi:hypothetical protein